jgi:hypothetical protein
MGKFDKHIARSKNTISLAQEDLKFAADGTYSINGEDRSHEIKGHAEKTIELHTRMIAGWEKLNY